MSNPKRFEMVYHYENIDLAIGEKIDEEMANLFNSSTHDKDRKDIREDLTKKSAESIIEIYHQAIMKAFEVGICHQGVGLAFLVSK
jgi:hypothetical protein